MKTKIALALALCVASTVAIASPKSDAVNKCLHSTTGLSGCGIKTNPATGKPAIWCPDTAQLATAQTCDNMADAVDGGTPKPRRRD